MTVIIDGEPVYCTGDMDERIEAYMSEPEDDDQDGKCDACGAFEEHVCVFCECGFEVEDHLECVGFCNQCAITEAMKVPELTKRIAELEWELKRAGDVIQSMNATVQSLQDEARARLKKGSL